MDVRAPITGRKAARFLVAALDLATAVAPELLVAGSPAIGHGTAEIGGRGGEVGIGVGEQFAEEADALPQLARLQERQAVLRDEQPAGFQAARAVGIELLGEQHHTRSDRVGGIDHDHVEAVAGLGHELGAVGDDDPGARVVIGAG